MAHSRRYGSPNICASLTPRRALRSHWHPYRSRQRPRRGHRGCGRLDQHVLVRHLDLTATWEAGVQEWLNTGPESQTLILL